ncbi:aminoglycoside phosphotransferase family protein [Flavobacteriaceae bacterium]|nr:aminoglycoside phosphotransferase family protein [Flavobacteriaceae bacterium]MDC1492485.1 aminoglycoside phosphotransferase family protein [Flavobacteriaceae bacterium]
MDKHLLNKILSNFEIRGKLKSFKKISSGYINDTFKIYVDGYPKYILQRINSKVFKKPQDIFYNMDIIHRNSINIGVTFIRSKSNKPYIVIDDSDYWRLMNYEYGSKTFDSTNDSKIAFECGKVLSNFHKSFKNINLNKFKHILNDFHSLPMRIRQFNSVCHKINVAKIKNCINLINSINKISEKFEVIYKSNLKYRLCHNDSKLNNILFDKHKKGLYLIDIDTIMPGLILYDFGDTVRTLVNPTSEEEKKLSKIKFNKEMFNSFINGFRPTLLDLEENEKKLLPLSVALMPFMHGVRALTDHLNGNKYFKVSYEDQNLIRAKNLIKFSELALKNEEYMKSIINS